MKNQFDFTIAITPNGPNLDREIQYIKSALLYADSITLISPVAEMYVDYTSDKYKKDRDSVFWAISTILGALADFGDTL